MNNGFLVELPLLTALITGKLAHGIVAGGQGPEVELLTAYGDASQPQIGPMVTLKNTKTGNGGIWPYNKLTFGGAAAAMAAGAKVKDKVPPGCSLGE